MSTIFDKMVSLDGDIYSMVKDGSIKGVNVKVEKDLIGCLIVGESGTEMYYDKDTYQKLQFILHRQGYPNPLNAILSGDLILFHFYSATGEAILTPNLLKAINKLLRKKGYSVKETFMYFDKETDTFSFEVQPF